MAATKTKKKRGKAGAAGKGEPADILSLAAKVGPLPQVDPQTVYLGHDNGQLISTITVDRDHLRERESIDPAYIHGLAASIAANGLKQPVGVTEDGRLVYGLCRLLAVQLLGLKTVAIVIDPSKTEEEIRAARATENLSRQDLNPIEEANAVASLLESIDADLRRIDKEHGGNLPDNEVINLAREKAIRQKALELAAQRLGKSVTWVRDRDFLGRLSGKSRRYVLEGKLPLAHAREISKVADPEKRDEIAEAARIGGGYARREHPMPMAELRHLVAGQLTSLASVPWKLELPLAGKPPCTTCPNNSANNAGLFDHHAPQRAVSRFGGDSYKEPAAGVCLLRSCYSAKSGAANRAVGTYAKRAVKELAALPAKERPAITAKSIEKHIPEFVRPSLVVERAKEEMQRAPAAAGSGTPAKRETAATPAKTAEQKAKERLKSARITWRSKVEDALRPLVKTRPSVLVALNLVEDLKLFEYDACRKAKGEIGPERARLLKLACEATPEALAELASRYSSPYVNFYSLGEWHGALELVAETLGLKVPAAPKLEDFMPKEKPAAKAGGKKAAKKASGKKKAKKKKVAKRGAGVVREVDVGDEGEDAEQFDDIRDGGE